MLRTCWEQMSEVGTNFITRSGCRWRVAHVDAAYINLVLTSNCLLHGMGQRHYSVRAPKHASLYCANEVRIPTANPAASPSQQRLQVVDDDHAWHAARKHALQCHGYK